MSHFAKYMKYKRQIRGLTQSKMAEELGISTTALKQIERGETNFPSKKLLASIAAFENKSEVDVTIGILFLLGVFEDDIPQEDGWYYPYRYLSMMYIDGWNLDEKFPTYYHPAIGGEFDFEYRISKRREPNNIFFITFYQWVNPDHLELEVIDIVEDEDDKDEYYFCKDKITTEEAFKVVSWLLKKAICVTEKYRGIKLVFNESILKEREAFEVFSKLEFNKINFDFEIILYSPEHEKEEIRYNYRQGRFTE